MIDINLDEKSGILVLRPEQGAALSEDDFDHIAHTVNPYIEEKGSLKALIVITEQFPGWKDFQSFATHLKFVHEHHRNIKKVALVSDSPLLSAAPHVVDHFVNAKIRVFKTAHLDEARAWAQADEEPAAGHLAEIAGLPADVVAFEAVGDVTGKDYEECLTPAIDAAIKAHGKAKFLYVLGERFTGYSAGAMWEDARLGISHLNQFAKIAVVTDVAWIRNSISLFAPLMPGAVRVFHISELEPAKTWIAE